MSEIRPAPLFSQLSGGRGGPGREEVARHQRGRLLGAMLEAVSRHGYPQTTVEEVAALAGVSKSTFYAQFADRRECFLATFDAVVEQATERIGAAYRSRQGLRERLAAAIEAFAAIVAEQPAAARLVVVDSLSLGMDSVGRREAAAARFELMLRQSFDQAGASEVSDLTIRVLVGGIRRVVYRCLRDGRPQRVGEHAEELLDWALAYATGAGRPPAAEAPAGRGASDAARPRPGAASRPGDAIAWEAPPNGAEARAVLGPRERIVRAAAQVTTHEGYAALSIPAISAAAGVSNHTFYKHFSDKQEAFLAAYEALSERALGIAAEAFASRRDWAEGVAAGIAALLEHTAADRLYARLSFFELPAAGPEALDRADTALEAFTAFLDPGAFGATTPHRPPPVVVEAIGGGAWTAVQHEIAAGRAASLPALAPELTEVVLRPFYCAG